MLREDIIELWNEGYSTSEIAEEFNTDIQTINDIIDEEYPDMTYCTQGD